MKHYEYDLEAGQRVTLTPEASGTGTLGVFVAAETPVLVSRCDPYSGEVVQRYPEARRVLVMVPVVRRQRPSKVRIENPDEATTTFSCITGPMD